MPEKRPFRRFGNRTSRPKTQIIEHHDQKHKQPKIKSKILFYVIQKMVIIPKFQRFLTNLKYQKIKHGKL